jgi:Ser/Thr protein kinase RdoA (MazF antagonist)
VCSSDLLEPVAEGRVNLTFKVLDGSAPLSVLQLLSPDLLATEALALGWEAAGEALAKAGLARPRMAKTLAGGFLHQDAPTGGLWRLTAFVPGRPPIQGSARDAKEAGAALGRAHAAWNSPAPLRLGEFIDSGDLANQRLCAKEDFEMVEARYRGHPNLKAAAPELRRGARAAAALPLRPSFARVFAARDLVVHRDAKLSNFLLGDPPAVIDLDTVGYGDPLIDLGELCRSAAGFKPSYDASLAAAALEGYRSSAPDPGPEAYRLLPTVVRAQAVNLARRYLTDSLAEVHFKWDRERYPSLHAQNLARGASCLNLAEELLEREFELMSL